MCEGSLPRTSGVTYFIIIPREIAVSVDAAGAGWGVHTCAHDARGALTLKTYGDRTGGVMRVAGYVGP